MDLASYAALGCKRWRSAHRPPSTVARDGRRQAPSRPRRDDRDRREPPRSTASAVKSRTSLLRSRSDAVPRPSLPAASTTRSSASKSPTPLIPRWPRALKPLPRPRDLCRLQRRSHLPASPPSSCGGPSPAGGGPSPLR